VCLFIFTPEVTVGAFDLSSTSSILKKELLKIGKIQFAQYQLSDDVDKLTNQGIGTQVKRADPVLPNDEQALWDSGVFNIDLSTGLSYIVFFLQL
jgi:hypothetical protein